MGNTSLSVIEAQAQVNEALAILPQGELKQEITKAMVAYADALEAWREGISGRNSNLMSLILPQYRRKYPELGTYTYEYNELVIKLGEIGHKHVDRISKLLQN